jgi:hypothetical protein
MRNRLYQDFALGNPQITKTDAAQHAIQPLVRTTSDAFEVVQDEQFREIAQGSYEAGINAHNAGHNRLALTAFGCALEAIVLDYLTALDPEVRETARTSLADPPEKPTRPDKWSFEKMIEVAQATPKLAASNLELADAVRDWRNLIHPAVIKRDYKPDGDLRPEARMAPSVIEALLRDLD